MKDTQSMLIQAADVLGNFSMSVVFELLGDSSKKRKEKADIFRTVFGDSMGSLADIASKLVKTGNDIEIINGGALTFQVLME